MAQASAQTLEQTGPTERGLTSAPQSEQLVSTPEQPLPKEKGKGYVTLSSILEDCSTHVASLEKPFTMICSA